MKTKLYLIYDNNCPFCKNLAFFLSDFVSIGGLSLVPNDSKKALKLHPGISKERIERDVHLVEVSGRVRDIYFKSDAVARVVSRKRGLGFVWMLNRIFPPLFILFYYLLKKARKVANYFLN